MAFYRVLSKKMHITCSNHKVSSRPTPSCIFLNISQGQIRVPNKGRCAHINVKLLNYTFLKIKVTNSKLEPNLFQELDILACISANKPSVQNPTQICNTHNLGNFKETNYVYFSIFISSLEKPLP